MSVRGRYGGYRPAPGYRLPPLVLSDDEAPAVLPGLIAGSRSGLTTTEATLLTIADAVRHRRPVSIRYTDHDGRPGERILHAHGIVAPAGRWYVTG